MKFGTVSKYVGSILIVGAFLILPALILALVNQEAALPAFGITFFIMLTTGLFLSKVIFRKSIKTIRIKEGLAIVTFSWVFLALFGALPFYLSGVTSTYVDAIFETVSGLTTTGASIIIDVEVLDQSILFWRSFTHWIGGMGILVFTIALLPAFGIGNFTMFKAESPGPTHGRITPNIKSTARTLYLTYFALTIVQIIFLMIGKVNALDASLLTFGTVGTGGFAILNDSVASYGSFVQIIIAIFMVASGVNFTLYVLLFQGKLKEVWADAELRLYLKILGVAVALITINLVMTHHASIIITLKDAFFQVASIMTTTGYATVDFNQWPAFSRFILLGLMFIGGSAGSTAGGIKVIRILILFKLIRREISKIHHPSAFVPIKLGNKIVSNEVVARIYSFIALHMLVFVIGTLLISLDQVDMVSAISAVAATLNNIGPGLAMVGPTQNFAFFTPFSKILFSIIMLLGRLELFTIIALIVPQKWHIES